MLSKVIVCLIDVYWRTLFEIDFTSPGTSLIGCHRREQDCCYPVDITSSAQLHDDRSLQMPLPLTALCISLCTTLWKQGVTSLQAFIAIAWATLSLSLSLSLSLLSCFLLYQIRCTCKMVQSLFFFLWNSYSTINCLNKFKRFLKKY